MPMRNATTMPVSDCDGLGQCEAEAQCDVPAVRAVGGREAETARDAPMPGSRARIDGDDAAAPGTGAGFHEWGEADDERLRSAFPAASWVSVFEAFGPSWSTCTVRRHAKALGLTISQPEDQDHEPAPAQQEEAAVREVWEVGFEREAPPVVAREVASAVEDESPPFIEREDQPLGWDEIHALMLMMLEASAAEDEIDVEQAARTFGTTVERVRDGIARTGRNLADWDGPIAEAVAYRLPFEALNAIPFAFDDVAQRMWEVTSVKCRDWSEEDVVRLNELVSELGQTRWSEIAWRLQRAPMDVVRRFVTGV
jgi:hypothetical protein